MPPAIAILGILFLLLFLIFADDVPECCSGIIVPASVIERLAQQQVQVVRPLHTWVVDLYRYRNFAHYRVHIRRHGRRVPVRIERIKPYEGIIVLLFRSLHISQCLLHLSIRIVVVIVVRKGILEKPALRRPPLLQHRFIGPRLVLLLHFYLQLQLLRVFFFLLLSLGQRLLLLLYFGQAVCSHLAYQFQAVHMPRAHGLYAIHDAGARCLGAVQRVLAHSRKVVPEQLLRFFDAVGTFMLHYRHAICIALAGLVFFNTGQAVGAALLYRPYAVGLFFAAGRHFIGQGFSRFCERIHFCLPGIFELVGLCRPRLFYAVFVMLAVVIFPHRSGAVCKVLAHGLHTVCFLLAGQFGAVCYMGTGFLSAVGYAFTFFARTVSIGFMG